MPNYEHTPSNVPCCLTGCLPRESKFGTWCPAAADHITVIPRGEWQGIIDQRKAEGVSNRKLIDTILDQDGVGSCSAEEATQAVMSIRAFSGQKHVLLNPWTLYAWTSGGRDGGSSIDANWRRARDVGVMAAATWPRSRGWRSKPPQDMLDEHAAKYRLDEFYDINNEEEFASALLSGFVVGYGRRNHAILAIEMLDADRFLYANSWGNWDGGWEERGFGIDRLSRDVYRGYGMFAARSVVSAGEL
jgi:hypothetical protein